MPERDLNQMLARLRLLEREYPKLQAERDVLRQRCDRLTEDLTNERALLQAERRKSAGRGSGETFYMQLDEADSCAWECGKCGEMWVFYGGEPQENDVNYCPHCGMKVVEFRHWEEARENGGQ